MSESALMGGDDSFEAMLQRRKHRDDVRESQRQEHARYLQQQAKAKEEGFFKQLGIDPSAPLQKRIVIAPRPPGES